MPAVAGIFILIFQAVNRPVSDLQEVPFHCEVCPSLLPGKVPIAGESGPVGALGIALVRDIQHIQ